MMNFIWRVKNLEKKSKIIKEKNTMVCLRMPPSLRWRMKAFVTSKGVTIKEWINELIEKNLT